MKQPALSTTYPELSQEWDHNNNGNKTPENITSGSGYKAAWICSRCRHHWRAIVASRARNGAGCPACKNRVLVVGNNDLLTRRPLLAKEWDYEANHPLKPEDVIYASTKSAAWQCSECSHKWKSKISYRSQQGTGCPACAGKAIVVGRNDFASQGPQELVAEWDYQGNYPLTPRNITAGTDKVISWICPQGHQYKATIFNRKRGDGCPKCSNRQVVVGKSDLLSQAPAIAAEWDYKGNHPLRPEEVTVGSTKKVSWIGKECGHQWPATVRSRTRKKSAGCAVCANRLIIAGVNDLLSQYPLIAADWDTTKNGLTAEQVAPGSDMIAHWIGKKCGHEWVARVYSRTGPSKTGCPTCWGQGFSSAAEKELFAYIKQIDSSAQANVRSIPTISEIDVFLPKRKIGFEYNGLFYHSEHYKKESYHADKYRACQKQGIQLIQIWEDEWLGKKELVKEMIAHKLGATSKPSLGGREIKVKETERVKAKVFLEKHHIQGHANAALYLGLHDKSENLVGIACLKRRQQGVVELVRYATSQPVAGGLGKVLSYLRQHHSQIRQIVTFADHSVSDGSLYEKLGFTPDKELPADYKYIIGRERVHKFNYRLNEFKKNPNLKWFPNMTEQELADLNGLVRIWDAGKTRYTLNL